MRWITSTLLFGFLAAGIAVNLEAQHAGGGHGGGSFSSTARSIGLTPSGIGPGVSAYRGTAARSFAAPNAVVPGTYSSYVGAYGRRAGTNGYRSSGYNRNTRGLPYGYWLTPYYYGPWAYDDSSAAGPGYGYGAGYGPDDPGDQAAMMAQDALMDQLQQLRAQVAQMQYGQQMPMQANAAPEAHAPQTPPLTLVLRNGQQFQVQNYAIMNQMFWDFSSQPTRKIPLSSIDVAASTRATAATGAEFPQIESAQ